MSNIDSLMRKIKQRLDFYKFGIRALALFQLYLALMMLIGSGIGVESLSYSLKTTGALLLMFSSYLLWIASITLEQHIQFRVALGIIAIGLLPLLSSLPELVVGNWGQREWAHLGFFLIGSGGLLEMYWKQNEKYPKN